MRTLSTLLLPALLLAVAGPAAAADAAAPGPRSQIEASTVVAPALDSCLDHSVVELGFGAKREGRTWKIGGEKVHAVLTRDGTVWLRIDPVATGFELRMHAEWPGAPKDAVVQGELRERLVDAVTRVARVCGLTHPEVACVQTAAGAKQEQCPARP